MHKKKLKINLKFGLLAIFLIGGVILIFQYFHTSKPEAALAETADGSPLSISIPKINVNTAVEAISKEKETNGLIDSPKIDFDTGWYSLGSKPGEIGSAVIFGYVHWKYGYTARFSDIHLLKPGDIINIKDDKGILTSFVVRESMIYDLNTDITNIFSSNDGKAHLNLVTYDGSWDNFSKSYSKRLVVFADKE